MEKYTIKQVADLAGLTTRALRYYDEIGLLPPAEIGANGYRYYNHDSLLRLQQVLFFRELEVPLSDIQHILSNPGFNLESTLLDHRKRLQKRCLRLENLITTIDQTIANLHGEIQMTDNEYFDGFDHSQYEEEARQRWGDTKQYAQSQKRWASYSQEEKNAIKTEGQRLTLAMVGENPAASPGDPEVQTAIADYLAYITKYFYTCDHKQLRGLADMWIADPRFSENYNRLRPGGAAFVQEAVHIFCDRNG